MSYKKEALLTIREHYWFLFAVLSTTSYELLSLYHKHYKKKLSAVVNGQFRDMGNKEHKTERRQGGKTNNQTNKGEKQPTHKHSIS
jgi:hypothetical protein